MNRIELIPPAVVELSAGAGVAARTVRSNRDCPTGEIGPDVKPCRDITDPFTTTHSKGDKSLDAVVTFVPPIVDVGEGETGK